jgi:uncharacterized protein YciI
MTDATETFKAMPLFAVHALDRPDALPSRLEHYAAHRAHVESDRSHGVDVIMSGPLQSPDGETMIGSLLLIAAPDQQTVEAFTQTDPFATRNVWHQINISRFHKRTGSKLESKARGSAPWPCLPTQKKAGLCGRPFTMR